MFSGIAFLLFFNNPLKFERNGEISTYLPTYKQINFFYSSVKSEIAEINNDSNDEKTHNPLHEYACPLPLRHAQGAIFIRSNWNIVYVMPRFQFIRLLVNRRNLCAHQASRKEGQLHYQKGLFRKIGANKTSKSHNTWDLCISVRMASGTYGGALFAGIGIGYKAMSPLWGLFVPAQSVQRPHSAPIAARR